MPVWYDCPLCGLPIVLSLITCGLWLSSAPVVQPVVPCRLWLRWLARRAEWSSHAVDTDDRMRPAAQQGAVADAATRPEIGAILRCDFVPNVFPIYRCGAAKRQVVGQLWRCRQQPFLAGWVRHS